MRKDHVFCIWSKGRSDIEKGVEPAAGETGHYSWRDLIGHNPGDGMTVEDERAEQERQPKGEREEGDHTRTSVQHMHKDLELCKSTLIISSRHFDVYNHTYIPECEVV